MPIDTTELMKQVARIRVVTKRLVDDHLSGEYHSVFKGRGIEFDEVREYMPGDDVRSIDWNVTARMGHPFVKRYCEERELTLIFLVDTSGSQACGSGKRTKSEIAAELTSILALSAIKNQDKVGMALFSDRIEKSVPPRKGRTAAMRLVREVLAFEETRRGTDIAAALRFLNGVQKRRAIVFLISDFQDANYERELRITARRHDLICCPIVDPWERDLPELGVIEVEDPETGALQLLDMGAESVRRKFAQAAESSRRELSDTLRRFGVDVIPLATDRPFVDEIQRMFRARQVRAVRG